MLKTTTKLLVTTALIAGISTAASAAEKVKWKLATTWGSTLTPFIDAPTNMATLVETMSDGKFTIRIDASNKHKAALGILDMVNMIWVTLHHITGKVKILKLFLLQQCHLV